MLVFDLVLQKTYYNSGFFNVVVAYDGHVRKTEGSVRLRLGRNGVEIDGRVDRHSNTNGTARVMGGALLKGWFQDNFELMDTVAVDLTSQDVIVLEKK